MKLIGNPFSGHRVLSIDPHINRVGIACFDRNELLDVRTKTVREGQAAVRSRRSLLPAVVRLLDEFEPDVLLLPETRPIGVRRRSRHVAEVVTAVRQEATDRGISVHFLTHAQVLAALAETDKPALRNRRELNEAIIKRFPEIAAFVPRVRRVYDPEPYFVPMFHAVAMFCAWRRLT